MPTSKAAPSPPFIQVSAFLRTSLYMIAPRRYLPREILDLILDYSIGQIDPADERYTMLQQRPRPYPVVSIHHPGSFYFVHLYKYMCLLIHVREERVVYYYDNNYEYEKNIAFVMP